MSNPRTEALVYQFRQQSRLWYAATEDMDGEAWTGSPAANNNPAAFHAVHILEARHYATKFIGLEIDNPVPAALRRIKDVAAVEVWPSPEELNARWETIDAPYLAALETLDDEILDTEMKTQIPMEIECHRDMLGFLAHHEAYHLGQWAAARRVFDRKPVMHILAGLD